MGDLLQRNADVCQRLSGLYEDRDGLEGGSVSPCSDRCRLVCLWSLNVNLVHQLCVNGVWCGLPVVCMECGVVYQLCVLKECGVVYQLCVKGVWCGLPVVC